MLTDSNKLFLSTIMRTMTFLSRAALVFTVLLPTVGCAGWLTIGHDYKPPTNDVPQHYKAVDPGNWKEGRPLDNLLKGAWWEVFGDSTLNALEQQAFSENQELKAAVSRVEQSRAIARINGSFLLPTVNADPSVARYHLSPNMVPSFGNVTADQFSAPLDLSYEIDLWGRVRRGFESARAEAQASLADYQNILLTLQADVAENYFALRALDMQIATVTNTVELREANVKLVRLRYENGIGNKLEVAQAETELATTQM